MYTEEQIEEELKETFKDGHYNNRTTFGQDFHIANMFGIDAVKDTFNRAFTEWKNDIVYLTELALVMNAYCWQLYQKNDELSGLYSDYYYQCRDYAYSEAFNEHEQHYYFRCTD